MKLCAYCCKPCDSKSKDHIVPKCLWEKGRRPAHLKTVPACRTCNSSFSEDETYFRAMLLAMLPEGAMSSDAMELTTGSFRRSIESGKIDARKLLKPSLQPHVSPAGIYLGHRPSIQVDMLRVNRIVGKIVKGFFYHKNKKPLPPSHAVGVWQGNGFWSQCDSIISQMKSFAGFGDMNFRASFLRSPADINKTFHLYIFYGELAFFAATVPIEDTGLEPEDLSFAQAFPLSLIK